MRVSGNTSLLGSSVNRGNGAASSPLTALLFGGISEVVTNPPGIAGEQDRRSAKYFPRERGRRRQPWIDATL